MKKALSVLVAVGLALSCLAGCSYQESMPLPHEGTWYFADNAVECHIAEGKIYEDDLKDKEGQTLRGIYSEMDGYIEANLAGVGGVQIAHKLYVVQTGAGEVLCDNVDGNGTIYFYRNALTAMEALEARETASSPELVPTQNGEPSPPSSEASEPIENANAASTEPPSRSMLDADSDPSSEPTQTAKASGNMVWIPQSGSKYHSTSSCSGMKNPSQITKAEAERKGYTPCKRCY